MKIVVTKQEFAQRMRRCPSTVSMWIKHGTISSAALIGTGVRARLDLHRALADLRDNLDPAQQAGREFPANDPESWLR